MITNVYKYQVLILDWYGTAHNTAKWIINTKKPHEHLVQVDFEPFLCEILRYNLKPIWFKFWLIEKKNKSSNNNKQIMIKTKSKQEKAKTKGFKKKKAKKK